MSESRATQWLASQNSQNFHHLAQSFKDYDKSDCQVVAVTGGKGGVGKTSVALKMAKTLSLQGKKILLIDCDYNMSNTAIKLGLPITEDRLFQLLSAEISFEESLYKENGFHLLPGCNGNLDIFEGELNYAQVMIDIINEYRSLYDMVILDSPAGLSQDNLILNAYADERIFVVTPDRSSITDSYSLVKLLNQKFGIKENTLLVNKYKTHKQFTKVVLTLSETVENFLSVRTVIMGGIPLLSQSGDEFDKYFLSKEKSSFHESFYKLVERFSERINRRRQATIQRAYS